VLMLWVQREFPQSCFVALWCREHWGVGGFDLGSRSVVNGSFVLVEYRDIIGICQFWDTMLTSRAPARISYFRSIFFVMRWVRLSGSMKILLDICPESSKLPSSSTGAAPDVAPLSKMPDFCARLFSNFCDQCAATLLPWQVSVTADITLASFPPDRRLDRLVGTNSWNGQFC
jgi:hypothetical protein